MPVGDVLDDGHQMRRVPGVVDDGRGGDVDPEHLGVGTDEPHLHPHGVRGAVDEALEALDDVEHVVGMDEVGHRPRLVQRPLQPVHAEQGRVHVEDAAVQPDDRHAERRLFVHRVDVPGRDGRDPPDVEPCSGFASSSARVPTVAEPFLPAPLISVPLISVPLSRR